MEKTNNIFMYKKTNNIFMLLEIFTKSIYNKKKIKAK